MSISLEQLSAQMRRGEQVPLRHTMQVVLTLSIPSILQQIVVTAVEYIDAAMVGHIGASATASIGIVSSSTWLMHGMLAGLYMSFAIQVAQYLGADRQDDARGVLRQSMIFNLVVGLAAAAFGIGISRFLPGWLGADPSLQADASAYFAIWSASLPFLMIMGTYSSMLRSSGDALTPGLISVLTCVLDVIFNFCLINPTREMVVFGRTMTVWGLGWGVPGAALGTALATAISGVLTLAILLLRDGPLCIRKPGSWHITKACLQNLWKVGAPLAAERAVLSSAQVLLIRIVSGLGTTAIAANSLGVSAESLCYMAGYGIQDASLALVGQAVGANRRDMAKNFAWLCTGMGIGIMALTGVGMYIFAPNLMGIFTADAAVIALGAQVLRIEALAEPMFGACGDCLNLCIGKCCLVDVLTASAYSLACHDLTDESLLIFNKRPVVCIKCPFGDISVDCHLFIFITLSYASSFPLFNRRRLPRAIHMMHCNKVCLHIDTCSTLVR